MGYSIEQQKPKYTYFDFKAGRCSDLEYMRCAYGGTVTKHFVGCDGDQMHPFFLIIREVKEPGIHHYEAKVYDLERGLIDKRKLSHKPSNIQYWDGDDEVLGFKDNFYFKEYVQFLLDSGKIIRKIKRSK